MLLPGFPSQSSDWQTVEGMSGKRIMYCGCLVGLFVSHWRTGVRIWLVKSAGMIISAFVQSSARTLAALTRGLFARGRDEFHLALQLGEHVGLPVGVVAPFD